MALNFKERSDHFLQRRLRRDARQQSRLFAVRKDKRSVAAPTQITQEFSCFLKCRSSNSLENTIMTNPIAQDSHWDFSFLFAVSTPLLGVLLAMLALAIFCR